jgi:hypothetical protein
MSRLAAASTIPVTSAVAQANIRMSSRNLVIAAPCVHGTPISSRPADSHAAGGLRQGGDLGKTADQVPFTTATATRPLGYDSKLIPLTANHYAGIAAI